MPSLIDILLPERVSTLHVVSQEAGYSNLSSFTREFRKHFACSLKTIRTARHHQSLETHSKQYQ